MGPLELSSGRKVKNGFETSAGELHADLFEDRVLLQLDVH